MKKVTFLNIIGLLIGAALIICAYPVFNGASLLGSVAIFGILFSLHARRQLRGAPQLSETPENDY